MKIHAHNVVYSDPKMYAGWPASHGAWQWGNELLVGFMRGPYKRSSMHNIGQPFERVLARSHDGGTTWNVEVPDRDFVCAETEPLMRPPRFDIINPDTVLRVCGVYDHGGDYSHPEGGFYMSVDRGHKWHGPYAFTGLEIPNPDDDSLLFTGRSRVFEDLIYVSYGKEKIWGTDATYCIEQSFDGVKVGFKYVSTVLADDARAVMPVVARSGNWLVVAMRRRGTGKRGGWVDVCRSDDNGATWSKPIFVGTTGGRNGNPPALAALPDGRLVCVYGNRDFGSITYAVSSDAGVTWSSGLIREGNEKEQDIGYPQLFVREDGLPVAVYYWADDVRPQQHIVATTFEV